MEHFIKVLNVRDKLGISRKHDNEIKDHPLIGKKVICLDSDKEYYIIDKVCRQWYMGYYIVLALVDENRSHRIMYYQNISCIEPIIVEDIEVNQKILQFVN